MSQRGWRTDLIKGYHEFRSGEYPVRKELYRQLGAEGQTPKVMIIACCDSRADPSDIFNTYPGEIFVLRNVANIVPPFETTPGLHGVSAAIEYAVTVLKVEAIVVMGHESCGGIAAFLDGSVDDGDDKISFIENWISLLGCAHDRLKEKVDEKDIDQRQMEFAGVLQSMENLRTFPFVEDAIGEGKLSLLGAYFSIIQGQLFLADEDGEFEEIPEA